MFHFYREERLKNFLTIQRLFKEGASIGAYPLRVFLLERPLDQIPVKVAFAAPKRAFKRAVDRNRIKRQMREAYRLQKPAFFSRIGAEKSYDLLILYTGKELTDTAAVAGAMKKLLHKICVHVGK